MGGEVTGIFPHPVPREPGFAYPTPGGRRATLRCTENPVRLTPRIQVSELSPHFPTRGWEIEKDGLSQRLSIWQDKSFLSFLFWLGIAPLPKRAGSVSPIFGRASIRGSL